MPELRCTLSFEIDGVPLPDMPIVRRYLVGESAGNLLIIATPDNNSTSYHPVQAAIMPSLGAFCALNDQAVNLKINLNTPLPLNAGGLILILGANLAQGTPNQNIEYNNPAATGGVNVNLNVPILGGT